MSHPTLSVIVPNYNHARFLPEALEAILSQSRQADEIVVVDDASTDNSLEVIEAFAARSPLIRVVRKTQNVGVIQILRESLNLATGTYWYAAAADDKIRPNFFEESLTILSAHPNAGLCSTLAQIIDEDGEPQGVLGRNPFSHGGPQYIPPDLVLSYFVKSGSWIQGNTTIYRREALAEMGGFHPELASFCDGFIQQAVALRFGACFVPAPLAAWRRMGGTYSWRALSSPDKAIAIREAALLLMRERYSDLFTEEYVRRWERRMSYDFFRLFTAQVGFQITEGSAMLLGRKSGTRGVTAAVAAGLSRILVAMLNVSAGLALRWRDVPTWLAARIRS